MLKQHFLFPLLALVLMMTAQATEADGDAVIRAPFGGSEIVVTTTARLAGAIHSVRWKGKEFIDSADHGRQLQSASSFDNSPPRALISSSRLVERGPAPSRREPASVGLKVSGGAVGELSKELADWSCRPWSVLSMNSFPFHVTE